MSSCLKHIGEYNVYCEGGVKCAATNLQNRISLNYVFTSRKTNQLLEVILYF